VFGNLDRACRKAVLTRCKQLGVSVCNTTTTTVVVTTTSVPGASSTTTTTLACTGTNANPAGGPNAIDLGFGSSGTDLDVGWTGIFHNNPFVGNSTLKACLKTCSIDGTPPCDMSAPVGAGTFNGESFGAPLPLLAANVPVCVVNEWNGSPNGIGTINPLNGDASFQVNLTSKVHLTSSSQVCPRCNGRCDGGPNYGKPCTVQATLTLAQAFGNKIYNLSSDCPPDPGTLTGSVDIRLPLTTGTLTLAGVCGGGNSCGGSGCGSNNCTGSTCASMGTD